MLNLNTDTGGQSSDTAQTPTGVLSFGFWQLGDNPEQEPSGPGPMGLLSWIKLGWEKEIPSPTEGLTGSIPGYRIIAVEVIFKWI